MTMQKAIARKKAIQAEQSRKVKLPPSNRKLADRLADAKREMDRAKEIYDLLRAQVIQDGGAVGDEFFAKISPQKNARLDRSELERRFGKAAIAECTRTSVSVRVTIHARTEDIFG